MKEEKSTKKKQKRWVKFRHRLIIALAKIILVPVLKIRYRLKYQRVEKKLPKSCIIMCNHQAVMDPFFISTTVRRPIYFIMSRDVFSLGFVSTLIKYAIAPIPKSKSKSDLNTIRYTLKVLDEGGTVGLFPSGNRTLSGEEWKIDFSTAKLVKLAKVPLALYNVQGGFGKDPRWGGKMRKGRVYVGLKKIITKEEIEQMSLEELHAAIVDGLKVDDTALGENFVSDRKAEYLERALYYCPNCHAFNSLSSDGNLLKCKNCDFEVEYGEDLTFSSKDQRFNGKKVADLFNPQKTALKEYANTKQGELFSDRVEVRLIVNDKRTKHGQATVVAQADGVNVQTDGGYKFEVKFGEIVGATILGKRKINFYLKDEKTLQLKGTERFSAVKYLHLCEIAKEGEKND